MGQFITQPRVRPLVPERTPAACLVCGCTDWVSLTDPGPQSMASDWRVLREPLAKSACARCGLGVRTAPARTGPDLYAQGYRLYAHRPGAPFERARQARYASWIAGLVPEPSSVLDVGCGNGSLLLALRTHWPSAALLGCDPSAEAVTSGAREGLRLWQGTAASLPPDVAADLLVTVNVIEHTEDPAGFLRGLRHAVTPGGHLVVICPDGDRAGLELLVGDHLFSLGRGHLHALLATAGFQIVRSETAPPELGDFQAAVVRVSDAASMPPPPEAGDLNERRIRFLERWRALDEALLERMPDTAICFGVGEAAGLLRAYAPRTWSRVPACTADLPADGFFGHLPVVPLARVPPESTVLVGVRPPDQEQVASRLRSRFARVVTWYDLVRRSDCD